MASLKEIFKRAQSTGKVEYTYFGGGTYTAPFKQTSLPFENGGNGLIKEPFIQLGYDPKIKFTTKDPTNSANKVLATARDVVRIGKFLGNFPNGTLFLAKQTSLQLSNPDTSIDAILNNESTPRFDASTLRGPRFYNPLGTNTLAQVGVEAAGLHFARHGLSPVLGGSDKIVGYISLNQRENNEVLSRLTLYKSFGALSNGNSTLLEYKGGPDSTYGIGKTTIKSYDDSYGLNTGVTNKNIVMPIPQVEQLMGFNPWSYQTIADYGDNLKYQNLKEFKNKNNVPENKSLQDFRQIYSYTEADNYSIQNIHNRIGVTTGQEAIGTPNTVDAINVLKITPSKAFYANSGNLYKTEDIYAKGYDSGSIIDKISGRYGRDIIKFRIEVLNNDKPMDGTELNADVLTFRAYLTDLSDNFTANWKEFNYMGRGESFYTYERFTRKINLAFTVFAHSAEEMAPLYTKMNYLMSSFAPNYNKNLQMRGNYIYLTVGDYIYRQPGVFTSMAISNLVNADNGNWEIAMNEPDGYIDKDKTVRSNNDNKHYEVPKMFKVTLQFNPIHNFLPERMTSEMTDHKATFITPNHHLIYKDGVRVNNRYLPSEDPVPPPKEEKPEEKPKEEKPVVVKKKRSIIIPPAPEPVVPFELPKMPQYRWGHNTQDATSTKWNKYTP